MTAARASVLTSLLLAGCGGAQSSLDPAGAGAERIAGLFWGMTVGSVLIWLAVVGLTVWAVRAAPERHGQRSARLLIVGGGVVFPTVVLAGLLVYGLAMLPPLLASPPSGSLVVRVEGEQWWWRVRYPHADHNSGTVELASHNSGTVELANHNSRTVELANELRLPVGEPVEVELESRDVVHSFWVPALGGKADVIPGRTTRLTLQPTRTGTFRGVCAEFCGASHALMAFTVVVLERPDYERWLALQATPARPDHEPRGRERFLQSGCGACHTVRGTRADGVVGPDLTHVGGRVSLAAGTLPNDRDGLRRFVARAGELKPEVHMPAFGMLPDDDLEALVAWLDGLE